MYPWPVSSTSYSIRTSTRPEKGEEHQALWKRDIGRDLRHRTDNEVEVAGEGALRMCEGDSRNRPERWMHGRRPAPT